MARSTARVDASQVDGFARRLALASQLIEEEGQEFQQQWGEEWAEEMRATVPRDTGRLANSIRQVEPGGITMGDAFYWIFLERGTSKMAPQPFVRPAMKRIRTPARKDASTRAINLIHRSHL